MSVETQIKEAEASIADFERAIASLEGTAGDDDSIIQTFKKRVEVLKKELNRLRTSADAKLGNDRPETLFWSTAKK